MAVKDESMEIWAWLNNQLLEMPGLAQRAKLLVEKGSTLSLH